MKNLLGLISFLLLILFWLPLSVGAEGLNRNVPSEQEIANYIKAHPPKIYNSVEYANEPSLKKPYFAGKVSTEAENAALNTTNLIRFIAGLSEVKLNPIFNDLAQHASMINSMNDELSHYPAVPKGLTEDSPLYIKGATGTGSSNLSVGYRTIASSIISGYMFDAESHNIDTVGHRRWILDPGLKEIGVGMVNDYSATYVFDNLDKISKNEILAPLYGLSPVIDNRYESEDEEDYDNEDDGGYEDNKYEYADEDYEYQDIINDGANVEKTAWPAENMPLQYINKSLPFSLQLGSAYEADIDQIKVTMINSKTGNKMIFDKSTKEKNGAYFTVNNGGYGDLPTAIIWRPNYNDIKEYKDGDQYNVHIDGVEKSREPINIDYTVKLFDLENILPNWELDQDQITIEVGNKTSVKALKDYGYELFTPSIQLDKKGEKIAYFLDDQVIKGKKVGTGNIVLEYYNQKQIIPLKVIPNSKIVQKVTLNYNTYQLKLGEKVQLKAKITPSTAKNKKVTFSTSNLHILKVSKTGKVRATGRGTAKIIATASNGKKAICKITVTD
ncbi:hypothetical protein CW357_10530 [Rummeliibacillus sp. TYF005]|uniref:Ig-like domain-containing protein n=1 Tax=Rummeliibacillus sp. TYF005 TaxID=2058214 RepID=UPI000F51D83E|nr:Ig-like domain-containing protein [Rummeliibacillus sp. TYF005]RPJ95424.1 hypothetical protein CW357_10530 [Rummeliibacillus sp. TYF005]